MGAVVYYLLSAKEVFTGTTVIAILTAHMTAEPEPLGELVPGLPAELAGLVRRMLAKERSERPASAREIIDELETISEVHDLSWSQREAHAWWDAHPIASKASTAISSAERELAIGLEGRTGASSTD